MLEKELEKICDYDPVSDKYIYFSAIIFKSGNNWILELNNDYLEPNEIITIFNKYKWFFYSSDSFDRLIFSYDKDNVYIGVTVAINFGYAISIGSQPKAFDNA